MKHQHQQNASHSVHSSVHYSTEVNSIFKMKTKCFRLAPLSSFMLLNVNDWHKHILYIILNEHSDPLMLKNHYILKNNNDTNTILDPDTTLSNVKKPQLIHRSINSQYR